MIFILIVLLVASVTFLITDFRRHLEIETLRSAHAVAMSNAYSRGLKDGFDDGVQMAPFKNVKPNTFGIYTSNN